jgi:cation/acetate symporter
VLELVREIRVPGGEVIYDREMRLLRLKTRERTTVT